jgi:hypothetical protein
MKNKNAVFIAIVIALTLGFIACISSAFAAFTPKGPNIYPGGSGLAAINSIFLIVETIPVWVFLPIGASFVFKKYYQQEKSILGITFLFIALLMDGLICFQWKKESSQPFAFMSVFAIPFLIDSCILIFMGLPKFFTEKNNLNETK